jgi:hypothetical protein
MGLDVRILQIANLSVQVLLIIAVLTAAYRVIRKRDFRNHCRILRLAVALQIIAIALVMLPSMVGYIEHLERGSLFNIELLIHHSLGLVVIVTWIYINLAFSGIIKIWGRLAIAMRFAFITWVATLLLGLHILWIIWP